MWKPLPAPQKHTLAISEAFTWLPHCQVSRFKTGSPLRGVVGYQDRCRYGHIQGDPIRFSSEGKSQKNNNMRSAPSHLHSPLSSLPNYQDTTNAYTLWAFRRPDELGTCREPILAVLRSFRNSVKLILPSLPTSASSSIWSIEPLKPVYYTANEVISGQQIKNQDRPITWCCLWWNGQAGRGELHPRGKGPALVHQLPACQFSYCQKWMTDYYNTTNHYFPTIPGKYLGFDPVY